MVQDTFVRVLEHRGKLQGVVNLRPWLVKIAWNLALDRRRRVSPDQMDETFTAGLMAKSVPADAAIEERQRVRAVLQEIDRLPGAEREVLLLSAVEEMGTAEIGQVLGKTESGVRALLFRARTRLRERLEKGGGR